MKDFLIITQNSKRAAAILLLYKTIQMPSGDSYTMMNDYKVFWFDNKVFISAPEIKRSIGTLSYKSDDLLNEHTLVNKIFEG